MIGKNDSYSKRKPASFGRKLIPSVVTLLLISPYVIDVVKPNEVKLIDRLKNGYHQIVKGNVVEAPQISIPQIGGNILFTDTLTVQWNEVENAEKYLVTLFDGELKFNLLDNMELNTTQLDIYVQGGHSYLLSVGAVDKKGNVEWEYKAIDGSKIVSRILKQGDQGEDVKNLQYALDYLGLGVKDKDGNITGTYGSLTDTAVRTVQLFSSKRTDIQYGVVSEVDGVVGYKTWDIINQLTHEVEDLDTEEKKKFKQEINKFRDEVVAAKTEIKQGMTGKSVEILQNKLKNLGLNSGYKKGIIDEETIASIEAIQVAYGINPTGIVDTKPNGTWAAILEQNDIKDYCKLIDLDYSQNQGKVLSDIRKEIVEQKYNQDLKNEYEAYKSTSEPEIEGISEKNDWKIENIFIQGSKKSGTGSYLKSSVKQVVYGNYADDVTLLGTGGQVAAGFFGVDLPCDVRDVYYDVTNWKWSWSHAGQTSLDIVGMVPIVGMIKYSDEVGTLAKNTDEIVSGVGKINIKIDNLTDDVVSWLGKDAKLTQNGDQILIVSNDGTKRICVNVKETKLDDTANVSVEQLENGKWQKINSKMQKADEKIVSRVDDLANLKNINNFRRKSLKHIFKGEVNGLGKAVGYHYEGMPTAKGKVIKGTEQKPNKYGVYRAKVEIDGVLKEGFNGYSTFFPKSMTPQEIVDRINEAFDTKMPVPGTDNIYRGIAKNGMQITIYLDESYKIITAFPVYP